MEAFTVRMQRVDDRIVIDVDDLLKMLADMIKDIHCEREAIAKEIVVSWHLSDEEKGLKMQEAFVDTGAAGQLDLLVRILERWKGEEIAVSDQEEGSS